MTLVRDSILTVTLLALVHVFASLHVHPRADGVPYCVVTKRAAAYDKDGKIHFGWAQMYSPCSEQDIYRNI